MLKLNWEPEEFIKILTISGENVPVNRENEAIVRCSVSGAVMAIPIQEYAVDSVPTEETIDGRPYHVKYFHTGDVHTDTIMCILYLCLPEFKGMSASKKTNLAKRIHKVFMETDSNILKILSNSDKDAIMDNMSKIYSTINEDATVVVSGVESKLMNSLLSDVFLGPSVGVAKVLSSLLSLSDFEGILKKSVTVADVVTGCRVLVQSKLAEAAPCVGMDTSTLSLNLEAFVQNVLRKSVELDDEYPIGVISYRRNCPVVIIDGADRVRIGPSDGDAHVLYRSKEDAVGIVGTKNENGFEAILESSLNL